ncbi:hypothetical protein DRO97_05040 [Archaeoglobales archaeon]|nr:MAG: hypothetical protein DRO97_05040 [Archaeoglobales archaeon]
MIAKYFNLVEKAVHGKNLDGRVAITSSLLLSLSIYISAFNPLISTLILIFVVFFARNSVYGLIASTPFLILFSISVVFFGGDLSVILAIAALISIGSGILYGVDVEGFRKALMYFKIPGRFAFILSLAFRMFQIYVRDLKNISEVLFLTKTSKVSYYKKLMKTFVSVIVLRSISFSETLYSRDLKFDYDVEFELKREDYVLIAFSTLVLVLSIYLG